MRRSIREFSGWGELLCLVVAWTVGAAAVWTEYAGQAKNEPGESVAVNIQRGTTAYFD